MPLTKAGQRLVTAEMADRFLVATTGNAYSLTEDRFSAAVRDIEVEAISQCRTALRELVEAGDNVNYDDTEPDPGYGDWRRFNSALENGRSILQEIESP